MSNNPYKPLTHSERGMLGGLAKVSKGFASPSVMAAALATRKANAEAKRAVVKSITDRFDAGLVDKALAVASIDSLMSQREQIDAMIGKIADTQGIPPSHYPTPDPRGPI